MARLRRGVAKQISLPRGDKRNQTGREAPLFDLLSALGLDPILVLGGLVLSTAVVLALYRRYIFSLFEPISMFLVAQIGDATTMLALPLAASFKWQFFGYMLCLWAGFALCARPIPSSPRIHFSRKSLSDLKLILAVLGVAIILANLYLGATAGFPLLTADPTGAKFTVYTGGLGIVRRINMGPYAFFCAGCALLIITDNSRRFAIVFLSIGTFLVIFSGGKSVLLPLLFALTFAVTHRGLCPSSALRKKVRNVSMLILGAGVSVALLITTKEHGGLFAGVQNFVLRLLLAGDIILYYYPRREIIMGLVEANFLGFLQNIFADTLGLFRLGGYTAPLGGVIMGTEEGGPNVQYFITANLFFGPLAGCLYSFFVGFGIAAFRNGFFYERSASAMRFALRLFFALIAFDLATEAGMFVTEVLIAGLCVAPLYVLAGVSRTALDSKAAVWLSRNSGVGSLAQSGADGPR